MTLKEIARMAGVSVTTVSRVLNEKALGNMRKETYERIQSIIKATGYTPDALAAGLRRGHAQVIGVIVPNTVNPYFAQLGSYIEQEAFNRGYLTLICNSQSDSDREKKYIKHMISQKVSGILLCSSTMTGREIKDLIPENITVVILDEGIEDYPGNMIIGDDFMGGYKGAEYLCTLGHTEIAVVAGSDRFQSSRSRLQGFLKFMTCISGSYDRNLIINGDYTINSAYQGLSSAMQEGMCFTAVFAFNDLMAIGAMKALQENNISIPSDVSVLGYDNIFLDEFISPKITTVATPLEKMSKQVISHILSGSEEKIKIQLEPNILIRDSCTSTS
jgi:LacI family transcriptional regulator